MNSPARTAQPDPAAVMRSIIKRIAIGPELSKDISRNIFVGVSYWLN